jgi:serine/threonine protein kinase
MAGFPKIPGCKIINELAVGGMSVVYLGIQKSLNRKVAIKILEPKLLKNEVVAKRFRREAKAAAYLSHSNIIQIIDVGKFRNHYYIIMEYLEDSLKERMKSSPGGKMNPQTALEIVKAIMGALEFAHSRKIDHRDIKPDNIMFRADNTPVLTDFGVARVLGFT